MRQANMDGYLLDRTGVKKISVNQWFLRFCRPPSRIGPLNGSKHKTSRKNLSSQEKGVFENLHSSRAPVSRHETVLSKILSRFTGPPATEEALHPLQRKKPCALSR
jgi:hypothetical protein